jgi:UDPglucose 6-dehydrogenase
VSGVARSNAEHKNWLRERITRLLAGVAEPRLALLGLTYKAGTDTLRRSSALELAHWCADRQIKVRAFDPAVTIVPDAPSGLSVMTSLDGALAGADVAVLATAWPEFRTISPEQLAAQMRRPCIIDEAGFLPHLAGDDRLTYVRVGKPSGRASRAGSAS